MTTKKFVPDPLLGFFLFSLLFLAAWLPRAVGLDELVTVDEPKWLTRSANFYQAVAAGDWAETYQSEHPGITIMWAGTAGFLQRYPTYARAAPGQFTWERPELEQWLGRENVHTPLSLLMAGRWWIVFCASLAIALGYFPLQRLIRRWPAFLASLFVAWDPFYIALSRQLHPDGLLASFTYLALLLFLAWLHAGKERRYLLLSGVAMGLAWLTKTPAIFLTVAGGLLVLIELVRRDEGRRGLVLATLLWGTTAGITAFLLWPVLWVNPVGTLNSIAEAMRGYVGGHENPTYFLGRITQDPGLIFYPVAVPMRWTPATMLGLGAALVLAVRFVWPFTHQRSRRTAAGLLLFAVVYLIGMSLGNKQFDRYALPAFLALDVIAAMGLLGLAQALVEWIQSASQPWAQRSAGQTSPSQTSPRIGGRGADDHATSTPELWAQRSAGQTSPSQTSPRIGGRRADTIPPLPHRAAIAITLVAIVLVHLLLGLRHAPYYLTYYNPVLGGSRTAQHLLMVGWGEGLAEAANWINAQPNGETARVVSWYRDGSLSYYLESDRPVLDYGQIEFWADADYAVVYVNQRQRQLPTPRILASLEAGEPAYVVARNGIELAWVYVHDMDPPDWSGISTTSATTFDERIDLIAHSLGDQSYLAGDSLIVRLYLALLDPDAVDDIRVARLLDEDGVEIWRSAQPIAPLFAEAAPHEIVYDHLEIQLPHAADAGQYRLVVAFIGANEDSALLSDEEHLVTTIDVRDAVDVSVNADWGVLRLTGLCHEPAMQRGESLVACFYAEGLLDGSLKASVRLVDPSGTTMAQADLPIQAETQVALDLPMGAEIGEYGLVLVVYDGETLQSLPDQDGNHVTELSTIEVR